MFDLERGKQRANWTWLRSDQFDDNYFTFSITEWKTVIYGHVSEICNFVPMSSGKWLNGRFKMFPGAEGQMWEIFYVEITTVTGKFLDVMYPVWFPRLDNDHCDHCLLISRA